MGALEKSIYSSLDFQPKQTLANIHNACNVYPPPTTDPPAYTDISEVLEAVILMDPMETSSVSKKPTSLWQWP